MNPFERHNIKHLSPSSLRLYREEPAAWVVRYLMGVRDEAGPGAWRGTAVEAGVDRLLFGYDKTMALASMNAKWNELAQGAADDKAMKESADLPEYLAQAQAALQGRPMPLTKQSKISIDLPGIEVPLIGFVDYQWADEGLDLKTTQRLPSSPQPAHVEQMAVYMEATGKPFSLLYVTPKKSAIYPVTADMARDAMVRVRRGAAAVRALLEKSQGSYDALSIFSPDMSTYHWSPEMVVAANRFYQRAAA